MGVQIWIKDKIAAIAKKYTIRKRFEEGDYAAYMAAYRLKIMDEVCSHMIARKDMSTDLEKRVKLSIKKKKWRENNKEKIKKSNREYYLKQKHEGLMNLVEQLGRLKKTL